MQDYLRYWGKAKPAKDAGGVPCHLLAYHSLDVAAVAFYLTDPSSAKGQVISSVLGIEGSQFQSLFTFLLSIHDLGKFSQSFQALAQPQSEQLKVPDLTYSYDIPGGHAALGMLLWKRSTVFRERRLDACGWPKSEDLRRTTRRSLEAMLETTFGHHGLPVNPSNTLVASHFLVSDEKAACAFALEAARLIRPEWPVTLMADPSWHQLLKQVSWQLAGLAVLADWLGSDQSVFTYVTDLMPLQDYWRELALPRARRQVERLGFDRPAQATAFPGVERFFGFEPTPLQSWAEQVPISETAQLFVLEDVTGAGKTEAAITISHRLLGRGLAEGVYFGLPTMATSNAMYGRIAEYYQRWFREGERPNLVLAHGAQRLHGAFQTSVIAGQPKDLDYRPEERSASAVCNQWFADSRKRALLADVGVGTVDQVLMGVLPFRHQSLRLVGMAKKVLLVDEIHACDDYMLTLLCAVLELHARQGGYAVLLTATLPMEMRKKLTESWRRGLGGEGSLNPYSEHFPLATIVNANGLDQTALNTRDSATRDLAIEQLCEPSQAIDALLAAAKHGQCGCWIRNTVDDAIEAYERLRGQVDDPDKVLLFHSRFTMADRQRIENQALHWFGKSSGASDRAGRILIGTQVLEQSLDICMDVMVSDLAPIDLLIQRAGRLHRHRRDAEGNLLTDQESPDQRPDPVLRVLAPAFTTEPDKDWIRRFLPGTAAVYRNHGQLWLTLWALLEEQAIRMPSQARWLIESVYGPGADVRLPDALTGSFFEDEGERQSQAAMGQFNRLDLDKGYVAASARSGWQGEVDIGTRLTDEPSVTVTLVCLDESQQRLIPLEDGPHPWEMSQIKIRQSLADKLPEFPEALEHLQSTLFECQPGLRFSRLWLGPFDQGGYIYDAQTGLCRDKNK
ncbi:MAG: CRISPR-associated helicase Cas3' [Marinobacter sp.]|uniref:CRISPR-associated helicase Cas3' n=1 Tax=Marinobacter sp. TaxID=50741 RepID=UPI00299DB5E0|nr:CRISPR-associated helicase Cas3' [Marinobacter sp.]MDX1755915.1 CRISPR-associated helicase Cas3' [Marinobacter sp.]